MRKAAALVRATTLGASSSVRGQASSRPAWSSVTRGLASNATRDSRYAKLSESDITYFKSVLPTGAVITDKDDLKSFNEDWMRQWHGHSSLCLKPHTTEQVSAILKHCNERRLAVVPQGGNTGLVGGSVPLFDEIVVSTVNMKKIINFDEASGILVCQAGCVLQELDAFLSEKGFVMPLDLGAKGSCQIGGNVSTNAGGLRMVRYGSLHGSVLGLEAVKADGQVLSMLSTLRKDNTGYDLKQLFIGSEGTLGLVTAVSILVPRKPKAVNVTLLGCTSFAGVQTLYKAAKVNLSDILSACEFFDQESLQVVLEMTPSARDPMTQRFPFYVLIETHGSNAEHDSQKLQSFLETVLEEGVAEDGVLAQDSKQCETLWALRETISACLGKRGYVYKYDLSIPITHMYAVVEEVRARLGDKAFPVGYGHLGDCNVHLNISAAKFDPEVFALIEPFVYEFTAKHMGSISAEHGLGAMKRDCIHYSQHETCVATMKQVKQMFDPNGILNPYKVLPESPQPRYSVGA
mmetsp:Transcript_30753/g.70920  ORF Transcript_30753/g.70920 Transcript_30753/m.70920 type:complete len:519 (+) Transcript_30753:1-1557(+)